jgi:alkylhydroperoxidase family enzyme
MFTIHTPETAPDGARDGLAALEQRIGFIPNLAATIAGAPAALAGFGSLQEALRRTTLTAREREVVGLTVSFLNTSTYSMAAHSAFAERVGVAPDVIAALRAGDELPDARLEAVRAFTAELVRERGNAQTDALTEVEQLEVVMQVAYTTFANLAANLASTPVDEVFSAHLWTLPR